MGSTLHEGDIIVRQDGDGLGFVHLLQNTNLSMFCRWKMAKEVKGAEEVKEVKEAEEVEEVKEAQDAEEAEE